MDDIAGWIAPAATMIAAMMTAANLGARFTGWGFVVFLVGSIAWVVVAFTSDQTNLLATNAFLCLVNLTGIWRWLGRQARFEDTAREQEQRSGERLFAGAKLQDMKVVDEGGVEQAAVVDAMLACSGGGIDHLIVREGGVVGVGETLRVLPWRDARIEGDRIVTRARIARLAEASKAA